MSKNPGGPARPTGMRGTAAESPTTYIIVTAFQSLTTSAWAGAAQLRPTTRISPVRLRSFDMARPFLSLLWPCVEVHAIRRGDSISAMIRTRQERSGDVVPCAADNALPGRLRKVGRG